MKRGCIACGDKNSIQKFGTFYRKDDGKRIQRYRCASCNKAFSSATNSPLFKQKKRRINPKLRMLLASGISMRRSAKILNVAATTVERRTRYLAEQCRIALEKEYAKIQGVRYFQFDELQTIEHTKCKPLSVVVIVDPETREILGFEVSSMPATGHLAKISRRKYGFRPDHRSMGLRRLFKKVEPMIAKNPQILSDFCPFYAPTVKASFPSARHSQVLGEKACVAGQGELKKVGRDPLFYINHTLAMLRANVNRLIRRTWCTTKDPARLSDHLAIYTWVHNKKLVPQKV
jgi:transposase-like protein